MNISTYIRVSINDVRADGCGRAEVICERIISLAVARELDPQVEEKINEQ